jgi:hypothetical protein
VPRGTHPPLKSYGLKRACIGPRASWAASCSSCLGTEAIRRGLKAAAAMGGAEDFGALSWAISRKRFSPSRGDGAELAMLSRSRLGSRTKISRLHESCTFVKEVNEQVNTYM